MSQSWKDQFPNQSTKPQLMSEAEHWWNHLTYAQREFCISQSRDKITMSVYNGDIMSWSWDNKNTLHAKPDWPETPMRSV